MKVAIVGTGRMGRRHLQSVRDLGLDLVGLCDHSEAALKAIAEESDIPVGACCTDFGEMVRQARPQCVIVATTAPGHATYTCQASDAGVEYILCEKPMGVSLADCDHILETCQRNGTWLAVNHQMRFMDQYLTPKAVIESEEFGGWTSITVIAGNCGIAMGGIHYFELFRWLTGETPVEVSAWLSKDSVPNPRGPEFQDRGGAVRLTAPSGRRLSMDIGSDQGHGIKVVYAGRNGQMVADELTGEFRVSLRRPEDRGLPTTRYGTPPEERVVYMPPTRSTTSSRAVLDALLCDRDPPTGEDGRLAVTVLVAAYVSDERGHLPVQLDEELPRERVFPWA